MKRNSKPFPIPDPKMEDLRERLKETVELLSIAAATPRARVALICLGESLQFLIDLDRRLSNTIDSEESYAGKKERDDPALSLGDMRWLAPACRSDLVNLARLPAVQGKRGLAPEDEALPAARDLAAWRRCLRHWAARIERKVQHCRRAERKRRRRRTVLAVSVVAIILLGCGYAWREYRAYGLTVTYSKGINFEKPAARRVETKISKWYDNRSPAWGMPRDGWSSRWEGYLHVPEDGEYTFFSQSMDGVRLWIDDERIIDNWGTQPYWRASGAHGAPYLTAGRHRILVEHYDETGVSGIRVRWTGPGLSRNLVLGEPYLKRR